MIASSTSPPILMEKSNQHQHQHQHQQQEGEGDVYHQNQQSLKCPRCDSSNTKFCYYNNYSLSQPRHFCKACKRYWTRGGTLRNVPVGGGCRKNKRVKTRPPSISAPNSNPNPNPQSSSSNIPMLNPPLLYGLPTSTDPTHLNLPYPNFHSRVSVSGYDGLGFSSGLMHYSNPNGFSRCPIFGSPSNFQQQKFMAYHEDVEEMMGGTNDGNMVIKDVKMEDSQNRLNWINSAGSQMDQIIGSSDPSSLWNTAGGVGPWLDPSNIGSSVPSLI